MIRNNNKKNVFPKPNTPLFNILAENGEKKAKTLKRWRYLNKWLIVPLYRLYILPLLGFGKIFLILQTKGRITGKKRYTPLEYHKIDGIITVISSRGDEAGWMKNMIKYPEEVYIKVGFKRYKPKIDIIKDNEAISDFFQWYVSNHGRSAKFLFGWNPKEDNFETSDFSRLLIKTCIVKFNL